MVVLGRVGCACPTSKGLDEHLGVLPEILGLKMSLFDLDIISAEIWSS